MNKCCVLNGIVIFIVGGLVGAGIMHHCDKNKMAANQTMTTVVPATETTTTVTAPAPAAMPEQAAPSDQSQQAPAAAPSATPEQNTSSNAAATPVETSSETASGNASNQTSAQ